MSDGEWLTYTEAAKRLGTTPDAIRQRVKRGQMQGSRGNDGRPRVWTDARPNGQALELSPDKSPNSSNRTESELSGQIRALEDHIETLKGLLIAEAERTQAARDEVQEARAEADHAKADQVRMARDVATMFDELKAMADKHAELHVDRARLELEQERLRGERNRAVLDADQAQAEIRNQRSHANALLSQVEDLNGSLDQLRRERHAQVDRLRAELKQERIRWWHRWFKR
jgi:chromosome segregation ATPase